MVVHAAGKQGRGGSGGVFHPGNGAKAFQQVVVEPVRPLHVVSIQLGIDSEEHEVLRVEADIHLPQVLQRPQKQTRANKNASEIAT